MTIKSSLVLLSDKSSGSSAVQREFVRAGAHSLEHTPHMEGETLYWMKAAALLEMDQPAMRYSKAVPYERDLAREELLWLLKRNAPSFSIPRDDESLVFNGWEALCEVHSPELFEKSPHHLHSRSALTLLKQASQRLASVEFRFIGLVRNPVDTLYSMWSRWRYVPEVREQEWVRAYDNLLWFKKEMGSALRIVRYEDIVADPAALHDIVAIGGGESARSDLHVDSVQKWRDDRRFGYQPSESVLHLGETFGYPRESMVNTPKTGWNVYSKAQRTLRVARQAVARFRGRAT